MPCTGARPRAEQLATRPERVHFREQVKTKLPIICREGLGGSGLETNDREFCFFISAEGRPAGAKLQSKQLM